eukprot:7375961-Prymnesium_polylepis.3
MLPKQEFLCGLKPEIRAIPMWMVYASTIVKCHSLQVSAPSAAPDFHRTTCWRRQFHRQACVSRGLRMHEMRKIPLSSWPRPCMNLEWLCMNGSFNIRTRQGGSGR